MSIVLIEKIFQNGTIFQITQGDITTEKVDAIVNAANSQLKHGGGVAHSIAHAGGSAIQKESDAWVRTSGPVSFDRPAYTSGGRMPCRYVIHAVGPIWGEVANADDKLAEAVMGSLRVADELKTNSIAFTAISTGIYGFPKERAAGIIFREIEKYFVAKSDSSLTLVKLVLYDAPTIEAFLKVWETL